MRCLKRQILTVFHSVSFCAWNIFGLHLSIPRHATTELYNNLSYETLSGAQDLECEAISDLVGEMNFKIKNVTLSNLDRKEEQDKKK